MSKSNRRSFRPSNAAFATLSGARAMILVVMVVLFCRLMNHEMCQEFACRDDTVVVHFVTKVWPFQALDRHAVSFENSFCVSHRSKGHDGSASP